MRNIYDFSFAELENYFVSIGEKKFRATQVYDFLYKKRIDDVLKMSNISKDIKEKFVDPVEGEEAEPVEVTIAGRLMAKRGHGKASFCDLQDMYGRIQIYVKK